MSTTPTPTPPPGGLTPRPSARVLLLDPAGRLFLVCYKSPRTARLWWITVGGAVEPGETYEQAALRELREETGIDDVPLGPWVWTYEHVILDLQGQDVLMQERFFVVHTPTARIDISGWDEVERRVLVGHRWWSMMQMRAAMRSFGPDQTFAPSNLADLMQPILRKQPPTEPITLRG